MELSLETTSAVRKVFVGPHGLRAGWRLLLFLIFAVAIAILSFHLLVRVMPLRFTAFRVGLLLPRELVPLGSVLLAAWLMSRIERRPFGEYGLPWKTAFRARFWEGALWGFAALSAALLILRATHHFWFGTLAIHGFEIILYAAAWGGYFVVVGLFEEFSFRGYPQFTLTTGMGFWPSALVLSAIFGAIHLGNPGEQWPGAVEVFVVAMLFCFTLRRTGDLWFAVGLHGAFDWAETFFYGVPDSGMTGTGHLLNSSFHGPAWLTGGSVGPEGSVVTLLILVVMFALTARRFPRVQYPKPPAPG